MEVGSEEELSLSSSEIIIIISARITHQRHHHIFASNYLPPPPPPPVCPSLLLHPRQNTHTSSTKNYNQFLNLLQVQPLDIMPPSNQVRPTHLSDCFPRNILLFLITRLILLFRIFHDTR